MAPSFLVILAIILSSLAIFNIVTRHLDRIRQVYKRGRNEEAALGVLSLQLKGLNEFLKTSGCEGKTFWRFSPARWIIEKILFFEQYIMAMERCNDNTAKSLLNLKSQGLHLVVAVLEVLACLLFKCSLWIYALLRFTSFAELRRIETSRQEMWNISRELPLGTRKFKIVFIRHGESLWNEAFNRGFSWTAVRTMITCIGWELLLIFSMDSVIFDAPLSLNGIEQASRLRMWLENQEKAENRDSGQKIVEVIRNAETNDNIRFYSSNLRRAISTLARACYHILSKNRKIVISSALQEVTRNPDGISLSAKYSPIISSKYETGQNAIELTDFYTSNIEWGLYGGNIPLRSTLELRFHGFLEDLNVAYTSTGCNTIVVCGHSLWIQEFFKFFIDPKVDARVKTRKLANCGMVAFDLYERPHVELASGIIEALANYYVEPGSIELNKDSCL